MRSRTNGKSIVSAFRAGIASIMVLVYVLGTAGTAAHPLETDSAAADRLSLNPGTPPHPLTGPREPRLPEWGERLTDQESPHLLAAGLDLTLSADTGADPGIVYNGGTVTYTLTIENQAASPISDVLVTDSLPREYLLQEQRYFYYLQNVECGNATYGCTLINGTEEISLPSGGTIPITFTKEITWSIPTLGRDERVNLTFAGMVIGQPEGTIITNRATAQGATYATSDDLALTVQIQIDVSGEATIAPAPTWFSQDIGGTISQDWGDFDRDGDLDLALGSSRGASVYRNEDGALNRVEFPAPGSHLAYGVRWADIDRYDDYLELVVVGDSVDQTTTGAGVNRIYRYSNGEFVECASFNSTYQLVRLAPGDYDGDGDIDLVASTNAINAPCNVNLYRNGGNDDFVEAECLSEYATAAIAAADVDDDGDLDLSLGAFPGTLQILTNRRDGQVLTGANPFTTTPIIVETFMEYIPYDLAWGDYDQDGHLDLAAAYPLQREARIYQNQPITGLVPAQTLPTGPFMTPLSVDWGDFDGDGWLDLAMADSPPSIYTYDRETDSFDKWELDLLPNEGQVWSIRGIPLSTKANLDLITSNRDGPSQLFPAFAPKLGPGITPLELPSDNWHAGSVAWGDADRDGDLDLLFGSARGVLHSYLYSNEDGRFSRDRDLMADPGPVYFALGDTTGNGALDIAVGTPTRILLYRDGTTPIQHWGTERPPRSLAWGDADDDGHLDLLVGHQADTQGHGLIHLYRYQEKDARLSTVPVFTAITTGDASSVAWGDYDGDHYLDFAVGVDGGPTQIYRNNGDASFRLVRSLPGAWPTRAIAWADTDVDGDLDLAEGNYGANDRIWENIDGTFSPAWTSSTPFSRTTSLAWGDWNNDGYPDLAVGTDGEPDVVYANLGSAPGSARFVELWNSGETSATTGVVWGDGDGDGDLDLAVSRHEHIGFYENTMWAPAHLPVTDTWMAPSLPNNPTYVYVERPGATDDAYFYSSSEILGRPDHPTVTIRYRLYDPEGDPVSFVDTSFEYSPDGGGQWFRATGTISSTNPVTLTSRTGITHTFLWNAQADQFASEDARPISDNARFRVRVVHQNPAGPVQRAASVGVSPPFRVRGQGCYWPAGAAIAASNDHPALTETVTFTGSLAFGSGQITANWDFDDGTPLESGWIVTHTFNRHGTFDVTLRVDERDERCTFIRPAYAVTRITVGLGALPPGAYLPVVLRSFSTHASMTATGVVTSAGEAETPAPVTGHSHVKLPSDGYSPSAAALTRHTPAGLQSLAGTAAPGLNTIRVSRSHVGFESQPAVNRDGSRVAFWSTGDLDGDPARHNHDGNIEIFLAELGLAGRITYTQVTSSAGSILGGFNLSPAMDDEGDTIAFFSDGDLVEGQNADHNFEVFVAQVNSDGSPTLTQVTRTSRDINVLPSISGAGTRIAFVSDGDLDPDGDNTDGNQEVFLAEIEGGGQVNSILQVTDSEDSFSDQPSISKDGRFIAFVSDEDGNSEIFLAEIDGSGHVSSIVRVTDSQDGINEQPSISGDGRRVAFVSTGNAPQGTPQIFLIEIDTGTLESSSPTQITHDSAAKDQPAISADGARVAYIAIQSATERQLGLYDVADAYAVRTGAGRDNNHPALTENGSGIAFISNWDIFLTYPPEIDLSISKTDDPDPVAAGDTLSYTLTVSNMYDTPAAGGVVSDSLPPGVEAPFPVALPDYTDDDNSNTGFGGGGPHGTRWDPDGQALTIEGPNASAYFDSRVMTTTTGAFGWNSIAWMSTRPVGIQLPDYGAVETDYPAGNVDMAGNVLLLHLNEPTGAVAFADTSGQDNNGSCSGTACPIAGRPGEFSNALYFDGVDDYVSVPDSPALDLTTFSIGVWVKPTQVKNGYQPLIVKEKNTGWARNYGLFIVPSTMTVHFSFQAGNCTTWRSYSSIGSMTQNAWNHVMMTYDGSRFKLYLNGSLDTSADIASSVCQNNEPLKIGRELSAYTPFVGYIDEVAIFDRALSPDAIHDHYLRGAMRVQFQARACDEETCNGIDFVGPDGTSNTYYPDLVGHSGLDEDFEGGYDNWTMTGLWNPETEAEACGLRVTPFPSSSHAAYYGQDGTCTYNTGAANSGTLTQVGPVPLTGEAAYLTFRSYEETECGSGNCTWDRRYVDVSTDGGITWPNVWGSIGPERSWYTATVDLSAYLDQIVLIRFRFDSVDSVSNEYFGWMVDDVRILPPPPPPLFTEDFYGRFPPAFLLNVEDKDYFQYRVYLDTDAQPHAPEITSITVSPRVNCIGTDAVSCYLDPYLPLAPMGSVTWTMPVSVTNAAYEHADGLVITNTATVSGIGFERDLSDNTTEVTTTLATAILSLAKTASPSPATAGEDLTYTLTIANTGSQDALNVTLIDNLPDGVTYLSDSASCTHSRQTVECDLNTIPGNDSVKVTITVNVKPSTSGTITNTAFVTSTAPYLGVDTVKTPTPVENPVPTLTSISPHTATAGCPAFTLTATGTGFVANSVVRWDGADRTTTFVGSTQLTAMVPAADITSVGTATVTVNNPAPGGGVSAGRTFTVENPAPTLSTISPTTATAGGPAFTLTVTGVDFVAGSVVRWDGADRTTTFVNSTRLTAMIPAADIASAGTATVIVYNPAPGGGASAGRTFTVENPAPTLSTINPVTTTAGGPAFTLTVTGVDFVASSVVQWGGAARTTAFVNGTRLTATITAGDIGSAGTATVTVLNPVPSGGASAGRTFTVENPAPTLSAISPVTATAGGPAFTLAVTGANFVDGSVVRWGGADRTTAFVSSTQLTATITAGDIASAGAATVTVFDPAPGGGVSAGRTFTIEDATTTTRNPATVENPMPAIIAMSPVTTTAGGPAFTLTITGTGFVAGSVVQWGGADHTTAFVSTTQLTATIPAEDISAAGTVTVTVTVFNPAPGGGGSPPEIFTVYAATRASRPPRGVATSMPARSAEIAGIINPGVTFVTLRPGLRRPSVLDGGPSTALFPGRRHRFVVGASAP
jgi:uncharacterized repeat protein (TIGR01451 family)